MVRLGMLARIRRVAVLCTTGPSGPSKFWEPLPTSEAGGCGWLEFPGRPGGAPPSPQAPLTCSCGRRLPFLQLQALLGRAQALLLDEPMEGVMHLALIAGAGIQAAGAGQA